MQPDETNRTSNRVEIRRRDGGLYTVSVHGGGATHIGGLLNIGGRTAAFPEGATVELGGGETDVLIREYEDSRSQDGRLLAVGFSAEAVL